KWRAARYGVDAEIIIPGGRPRVLPLREGLHGWLDRLAPHARQLGCQTELASCADLADTGPSYARMRREFERSGDLRTVVRLLADETGADAPSNLRS
ncbi:MAG: glutamate--cysteine ligase, partial [Brooklawnia sp.]